MSRGNNVGNLINVEGQNLNNMPNNNSNNGIGTEENMKVKDFIDQIRKFDGTNSLDLFLKDIERVAKIVGEEKTSTLVLYVRTRLEGEALRTIDDINFETLEEFLQHFKNLYKPTKNYTVLQNKLALIYQFENNLQSCIN